MTFVKICGITNEEHLLAARKADAVGFVVASPESHRNLDLPAARHLVELAGPFQTTVAVTAHRTTEGLLDIVRQVRPQAIQVPFRAGQSAFDSLRAAFPSLRILVACRPEDAHLVPDVADALVLDAAAIDGYGGQGVLTDWKRARSVRDATKLPVILAGGLTPENVADAAKDVQPYGVDVSSGVETDKKKDAAKIKKFLEEARKADA